MTYRLFFIVLASFLLASMLQFLPVPIVMIDWVPQWIALVVIYWALLLDNHFKLLAACFIGLCVDVMTGTVLGQHALALLWLSWLVIKNGRHLRRASRVQQIAEVGLLIFSYQLVLFAIQGIIKQPLNLMYFMASLSSAIIWPWISIILDDRCQKFIHLNME